MTTQNIISNQIDNQIDQSDPRCTPPSGPHCLGIAIKWYFDKDTNTCKSMNCPLCPTGQLTTVKACTQCCQTQPPYCSRRKFEKFDHGI